MMKSMQQRLQKIACILFLCSVIFLTQNCQKNDTFDWPIEGWDYGTEKNLQK